MVVDPKHILAEKNVEQQKLLRSLEHKIDELLKGNRMLAIGDYILNSKYIQIRIYPEDCLTEEYNDLDLFNRDSILEKYRQVGWKVANTYDKQKSPSKKCWEFEYQLNETNKEN